jgi:translation initiation factor IF-1
VPNKIEAGGGPFFVSPYSLTKMPGVKNTTRPQGRMAKAAADKNDRAIRSIMGGEEGNFGRVEKALGNRQFYVRFFDGLDIHPELTAIPRGVFSAGGKARVRICTGDIVVLDGVNMISVAKKQGKTITLEITAKLDKKEAQQLYKQGRIHSSVYQEKEDEEDDLFDHEDIPDEDDIDISAI